MDQIYQANAELQRVSPWILVTQLKGIMADTTGQEHHALTISGSSPEGLEAEIDRTVYICAETLRMTGILLQAFIPESAGRLLDLLGVQPGRRDGEWCTIGKDDAYGVPMVELGKGEKGVLCCSID